MINGMKYVGITGQDVKARWQGGLGYRKQKRFYNAIKKYGWESFEHEVVACGLTIEDAAKIEQDLIAKYRTTEREYGYNRSTGGESGARGVQRTDKDRERSSRTMKKLWERPEFRENAMKRLELLQQDETIQKKRSLANKGRVFPPEIREKMSAARKGIKTGPFTEEHKRKIKEHHAGGADSKSVLCVETGETFNSINDAARAKTINKKTISGCCRGLPHNKTAGGFHWKFIPK